MARKILGFALALCGMAGVAAASEPILVTIVPGFEAKPAPFAEGINQFGTILVRGKVDGKEGLYEVQGGRRSFVNFSTACAGAAIDARGDVAGGCIVPGAGQSPYPAYLTHGIRLRLEPPGAVYFPDATAISRQGIVGGSFEDRDFVAHAYTYGPRRYKSVALPPGDLVRVVGVNDTGSVLLSVDRPSSFGRTRTSGRLLRNGRSLPVGPAGAIGVFPAAINDAGTIAGGYQQSFGAAEAGFIQTADGTVTTFTTPQGALHNVIAINAGGDVTGNTTLNGLAYGFIRTRDGTTYLFGSATPGTNVVPIGIADDRTIAGFVYPQPDAGAYQVFTASCKAAGC